MFLNRSSAIVAGLVMLVFGGVFLLWPGFTMTMLATGLGIALLVAGICAVVGWWITLRDTGTGGGVLLTGIVAIILGLVCLIHPLALAETIGWVIAGSVILSGVVQLIVLLTARDLFGKPVALGTTVLTIAFGALALAMPELIVQFLGVSLVIEGITSVVFGILSRPRSRKDDEPVTVQAEEVEDAPAQDCADSGSAIELSDDVERS